MAKIAFYWYLLLQFFGTFWVYKLMSDPNKGGKTAKTSSHIQNEQILETLCSPVYAEEDDFLPPVLRNLFWLWKSFFSLMSTQINSFILRSSHLNARVSAHGWPHFYGPPRVLEWNFLCTFWHLADVASVSRNQFSKRWIIHQILFQRSSYSN